jgi:hypothetical protein
VKAKGAKSREPKAAPATLDTTPFLATVMRHELYGTLNAITMVAGLLGERGRKGVVEAEELVKLSGRLLKQIERATTIVDHYVELIGPGGDEDDGASCGAVEIRRALETSTSPLKLELAGLPADAELSIDAERLRFAIVRVIGYAASKTAGKPVRVSVASQDEDFVTVDIQYSGDALGADDLHVFERGPRSVEPELIDLAVARRVVTDAGGEVAASTGQIVMRLPRALD